MGATSEPVLKLLAFRTDFPITIFSKFYSHLFKFAFIWQTARFIPALKFYWFSVSWMYFQGKQFHWEVSSQVKRQEMILASLLLPSLYKFSSFLPFLCSSLIPYARPFHILLFARSFLSFHSSLLSTNFEWKFYHRIRN